MLQSGEVKQETFLNIVAICDQIQSGDFAAALALHQSIVAKDWEKNKEWLIPLKRVLVKK